MDPETRPPLSVVIPTIRGWPWSRLCLEPLRAQALALGVEVVLLDASDGPVPTEGEIGFPVRWLKRPGASVFQMRSEGYRLARGEIIATVEDHCTVAPDWCERVLAVHREHPEAVAVGGAVENGTPGSTLHWAAFFRIQGPFMAPLANGPATRLTGAANLSYKRRFVERFADLDEEGLIDNLDQPELEPGEVMLADDSLRVAHHQATDFLLTSQLDFHNGRSTAGKRRRPMGRSDWVRLATLGILPLYRTLRTYRTVRGKHAPHDILVRTMPTILWLHYCQAAGELVGYASGPGTSPQQLY
jgi:hypothetical protein